MTAYDFSLVGSSSFAFDADSDTISFGTIDAATLTITDDGTNTTITDGTTTVTLEGFRPFEIDTGNFLFTGSDQSEVVAGDDDNTTATDDSTNDTLTETQANQNNLFIGFGGEDTITTGNGDVVVFGGSGIVDADDDDDSINGGTGASTYYGNAGDDTINSFAPASGSTATAYGGADDDLINTDAGAGNVVLYGNSGDDTIDAEDTTGDVTIFGGNGIADSTDGDDDIDVGVDTATVYANSGNDDIDIDQGAGGLGAGESITIFAGTGNDSVNIGAAGAGTSSIVAYGNTGNDVLNLDTFAGDATIFGGNGIADSTDGADTITAGDNTTVIYANAGDDLIDMDRNAAWDTTVYGGIGDDTINVDGTDAAEARIFLADTDGDDVVNYDITNGEAQVTISGFDADNDIINVTLTAGDDAAGLSFDTTNYILTDNGAGDDVSMTFSGLNEDFNSTNFVINGGSVFATNLFGTAGASLDGSANDDQLISGSQGDTLDGGTGGDDKIEGGAGADTAQFTSAAFTTNDTFDGGTGTDVVEITDNATVVAADFTNVSNTETLLLSGTGAQAVTLAAAVSTAGIENLDASAANSTVQLDAQAGFVGDLSATLGSGADDVTLSAAADIGLILDSGNDEVTLASANLDDDDTLNGGSGTDDMHFSAASTNVDDDFEFITNFETLTLANAAANDLTLGANFSSSGITTITGATTNAQTIDAGSATVGLDITGSNAGDELTGGTGDDTLTGGGGADTLTGGNGSDTFDFNNIVAAGGIVTEFVAGAGGDVYLVDNGTDANLTAGATISLVDIGSWSAASDEIVYDTAANIALFNNATGAALAIASDTGDLIYDSNGDFTAGSLIIANVTTLTGTFTSANIEVVA